MPKADATELAPKKSAQPSGAARPAGGVLPVTLTVPRLLFPVCCFCGWILNQEPHFFGEAPEQRPWATKREDRPAAFAGRSKSRLLVSRPSGYCRAYTGEYPIRIIFGPFNARSSPGF